MPSSPVLLQGCFYTTIPTCFDTYTCQNVVFYITVTYALTYVAEELGGRGKQIDISCNTPGRQSSDVFWLRDNVTLDTGNAVKYVLASSNTRLTVKNIVGIDEGNYSCKYENSEGEEVTSCAGCLIVFGKLYRTYIYMYNMHI